MKDEIYIGSLWFGVVLLMVMFCFGEEMFLRNVALPGAESLKLISEICKVSLMYKYMNIYYLRKLEEFIICLFHNLFI